MKNLRSIGIGVLAAAACTLALAGGCASDEAATCSDGSSCSGSPASCSDKPACCQNGSSGACTDKNAAKQPTK